VSGWVAEHPQSTFHYFPRTTGLGTSGQIWVSLKYFPVDQIHKAPHGDYCRSCAAMLRKEVKKVGCSGGPRGDSNARPYRDVPPEHIHNAAAPGA